MPSLSILIPHKHVSHNDDALSVALDCIVRNTRHDYELIVDTTTPGEPYSLYNALAKKAAGEFVVFSNTDVFFAPDWDVAMLAAANRYAIVTGILVECGAIGVSDRNVNRDFGRRPDTFRRDEFESWCATSDIQPTGIGWYMPCCVHRETFLKMGGFDTSQGGFPIPLDGMFWDKWKSMGLDIQRVRSFAYHLQNFSDKERTEGARVNG